jgi:hypothetical protein
LSSEKNKEVVKQYYEALNNENWEIFDSLIHDEFTSGDAGEYIREITEAGMNPFVEFFKLLGYGDNTMLEVKNRVYGSIDKQSEIEYIKWHSQYVKNYEIRFMIADDNQVWLYVNSVFITVNERKLNHSSFEIFTLKDSKIIEAFGSGRYLGSLMALGKVIIAENNKEEVKNYLQVLRNLGLLPQKIENMG